jgi:hypothetical protein
MLPITEAGFRMFSTPWECDAQFPILMYPVRFFLVRDFRSRMTRPYSKRIESLAKRILKLDAAAQAKLSEICYQKV